MTRFLRLWATFVLLLAWESACRKRQVAVPLPPPPAPESQPARTAPAATTPDAANSTTTTHPAEDTPYQVNKPPQPAAPAKKPSRSAAAPVVTSPPPAPAPAAPAAPAPPPPKLGDILKPDEQRQYSSAIDQSLSHAQASLSSIAGRQLKKDQQAQMDQIRNFMQQAQATRGSDPAGAKSLAARAAVLARDLAATFR